MSDNENIKRAGCFEGDKKDPKALCIKRGCPLRGDCMWTKEKVPSDLGSFPETRSKILNNG